MAWHGFHRLPHDQRMARIQDHAGLADDEVAVLTAASALPLERAEAFVENAAGTFPMPLGFAVGFDIDGEDVVVPMAVEESSVIAAASHGAKLAGRFETSVTEPIMIGQVEVRDARGAEAALAKHKATWMARVDATMERMVARGGGCRDITLRTLAPGHVVVHLHIDCRDAMGANLVNTACEAVGSDIAAAMEGTPGLRILSNLADGRLATARCSIPLDAIGEDVAAGIVAANDLALADPYRAATHNKGILNGIDPVVIATGNDWRAIEAGAHAHAARDGQYRGLTQYRVADGLLIGELTLPMAVGTVGGVTALHPVARACLKVLGSPGAGRLGRIGAAVGLAQNLAALRALSQEGIQKGHMALHAANRRLRDA